MSALERREPRHWHHENGSHRMPDPRQFEDNYPRKFWDEDERWYVAHLEAHERLAKIPVPQDDDSEKIKTLFELIEKAEATIDAARELINAERLVAGQSRATVE